MIDYTSLGSYAVLLGGAVGYLRWGQVQNSKDIASIKRFLGMENGQRAAVVRTSEWELDREAQDQRSSRLEDELRELRARLND